LIELKSSQELEMCPSCRNGPVQDGHNTVKVPLYTQYNQIDVLG
jgi:hypothetical protein